MTLGVIIGNIRIKGISFGLSASIFAGMFFGYLTNRMGIEFTFPPIIQQLGLIFFIYTIGMQAGPSFIQSLKSDGRKMIILAFVIIASGAGVTLFVSQFFDINQDMAIGLFMGSFTSTPGLAAAVESSGSTIVSIAYGIAYPFGVIGVILFVNLVPKLFRVSVTESEKEFNDQQTKNAPEILSRNFKVENEKITGKSIKALEIKKMVHVSLPRILRHNGEKELVSERTVLQMGDILRAVGTEQELQRLELIIGTKSSKIFPRSGEHSINWYVVTEKNVIGKSLNELNLSETYLATATRLRRSGLEFLARPSIKLRYGDRLLISSTKGNVQNVETILGNRMKELAVTRFLPISLGIVVGVLIGMVTLPLFGINISLGLTGGVLFSAVIFSNLGKTGPVIWYIPNSANNLLREIGLVFFLIPVGYNAGSELTTAFAQYGSQLFLYGMLITIIPLIIGAVVGLKILKLNLLTLLGTLCGGMTSTPGLSATDNMTSTDAPQVAYAGVYPFALVMMVLLVKTILI